MSRHKRWAAWARSGLAGWAVLAAAAASAGQTEDFAQALRAYERNHWASAFAGFAELADQGHAPSARLALLMLRYGPRLYASRFEASAQRQQQWLQAAASEGSVSRLATGPKTLP